VRGEIAELHAQFLPLSERWAHLTQRRHSSHIEAHPDMLLQLTSNNVRVTTLGFYLISRSALSTTCLWQGRA
jgi:hypothetical protein